MCVISRKVGELNDIMIKNTHKIVDIKLGGYQPVTSVHNRAAEVLKIELTERVGDDVNFQVDGNMTLSSGISASSTTIIFSGVSSYSKSSIISSCCV